MDREKQAQPSDATTGESIALFQRLKAFIEADLLAHPEGIAPEMPANEDLTDQRFPVVCAAVVILLSDAIAGALSHPESAMRMAHMVGHQLMQGTVQAWNKRIAEARSGAFIKEVH